MNGDELTQFYDDLKSKLDDESPKPIGMNVSNPDNEEIWKRKALHERDKLKDHCCKHVLLDIYCKILPLDHDYIHGHHHHMKHDIDAMLNDKGMSATQYLTSCRESTNAPLLDFILKSCDMVGRQFMEDAEETLKDAKENDMNVPPPEASTEDEDIEDQLVDVKNDTEYETFIDKLKQKTINKIVTDVSKIITDKKEENNMKFNPKPEPVAESAMSASMDYMQMRFIKENVNIDSETQEQMIGLAIRESTLNQLDLVFNQPHSDVKSLSSKIRFGKGVLINESAISDLIQS